MMRRRIQRQCEEYKKIPPRETLGNNRRACRGQMAERRIETPTHKQCCARYYEQPQTCNINAKRFHPRELYLLKIAYVEMNHHASCLIRRDEHGAKRHTSVTLSAERHFCRIIARCSGDGGDRADISTSLIGSVPALHPMTRSRGSDRSQDRPEGKDKSKERGEPRAVSSCDFRRERNRVGCGKFQQVPSDGIRSQT